MKMTHLLLSALLGLALLAPAPGQTTTYRTTPKKLDSTLDWMLGDGLWEHTPDTFEIKAGVEHFVWQDKERTRARFNPDRVQLKLSETDVGETLVSFKNGKLASVTISVINKGDDGEGYYASINKNTFTTTTTKIKTILDGASGVKPIPRKKEELVSSRAEGLVWRSKKALYVGEWLFLPEAIEKIDGWIYTYPEHAEYIRVRILPPAVMLGAQHQQMKTTVSRPTLAKLVKREGKKALIPGIPMVDQGSKGYCAVATFERIMRYYGADMDMHDLANLAETTGGTRPAAMKSAVQKISYRLGMHSRFPFFQTRTTFASMFREYNVLAKKKQFKVIKPDTRTEWSDINSQLLKEARASSPDFLKFKQEIVKNIDKGIPIMWALRLGLFWEDGIEDSFEANRYAVAKPLEGNADITKKEEAAKERKAEMAELRRKHPDRPPEYMGGGHLRLIIGYDATKNILYYSDSWGPGHELKEMPIDQAFAGTLAVFVIEPQ